MDLPYCNRCIAPGIRRDVIWTLPCGLHLGLHPLVRPRDTCSCRTLISTMVSKVLPRGQVFGDCWSWSFLTPARLACSQRFSRACWCACALHLHAHPCTAISTRHAWLQQVSTSCVDDWHRRQCGSVCVQVPVISSEEAITPVTQQSYM